jgi:hypothetical protein
MNHKKVVFLSLALSFSAFSFAQKSNIREANRELDKAVAAQKDKKADEATEALKKAKAAIDLAVADPSTAGNAKAWYSKANIYFTLQGNENFSAQNPYKEALTALNKSFELDPKLKDDQETTILLVNGGFYTFNNGVDDYNDSKFDVAYIDFTSTLDLLGKKKEQRFILYPSVDTIRAQSKMLMAYSAFYLKKYDESLSLLKEMKDNEYLDKKPNIYIMLAQAYEKTGDKEAQLKAIEEGKQKFPEDANLSNAELNYYIASGKKDEMIAKLNEAAAKDPDNPELPFNLGMIYDHMAHPDTGNPPANAGEYEQKAISFYQKAISMAPENGTYNYQFGAYYFNRAVEKNKALNDVAMNDNVQYTALKKDRDDYFAKALPLLEKSRTIFSGSYDKLSAKEKDFYIQNLQALSKIYAIQNKLDQAKSTMDTLKDLGY